MLGDYDAIVRKAGPRKPNAPSLTRLSKATVAPTSARARKHAVQDTWLLDLR